jgi:lysophospholipase L1-like esterase
VALYNAHLVATAMAWDVPLINVRIQVTPSVGLLEDGLHLNVEGHRIYADVVQSVLDEWFHPPRS